MKKTTPSPDPALHPLIDLAVADLSERLAVAALEIQVVEARAVVWPDGSLGCPRPGMAYTQVMTEGVLIRLKVGENVYQYHGGGGRPPFLCENPAYP